MKTWHPVLEITVLTMNVRPLLQCSPTHLVISCELHCEKSFVIYCILSTAVGWVVYYQNSCWELVASIVKCSKWTTEMQYVLNIVTIKVLHIFRSLYKNHATPLRDEILCVGVVAHNVLCNICIVLWIFSIVWSCEQICIKVSCRGTAKLFADQFKSITNPIQSDHQPSRDLPMEGKGHQGYCHTHGLSCDDSGDTRVDLPCNNLGPTLVIVYSSSKGTACITERLFWLCLTIEPGVIVLSFCVVGTSIVLRPSEQHSFQQPIYDRLWYLSAVIHRKWNLNL